MGPWILFAFYAVIFGLIAYFTGLDYNSMIAGGALFMSRRWQIDKWESEK